MKPHANLAAYHSAVRRNLYQMVMLGYAPANYVAANVSPEDVRPYFEDYRPLRDAVAFVLQSLKEEA